MIDCHIHISLDGINFKKARERLRSDQIHDYISKIMKKYKDNGIYILRDGGDDLEISSMSREIANSEGIILKSPIKAIYKKGLYGNFLGEGINDIDDFKILFKHLKEEKIDHLKIVLSGIIDFNEYGLVGEIGFTKKELEYMVNIAKDNNLKTMVHVNSKEGIQLALDCEVDTIEHGYYINEEQLYQMKEKDIVWVPTLSPLGNIVENNDANFKECLSNIEFIYNNHLKSIANAYSIGTKIAIGSDSGSYLVEHVKGTFDEIKHFEKTGIKRHEILQMAIQNGMQVCY